MNRMDPDKVRSLQIRPEARRRSSRLWWLLFGLILLITAVAAYYGWRPRDEKGTASDSDHHPPATAAVAATPPATSPPAETAAKKTDVLLTVSGYIVTRERIELSPRLLGVVKWIGIEKSDVVTNGQIVARLDDAEQRARLRAAQGRLESARVALTKAELDYERIRQLIERKVETQQHADDYRLAVDAAKAQFKEAEGEVALWQTYLDWTVIRSPVNGVVLEKLADAGELVSPQSYGGLRGPSTAIAAIADLADLQVEVDLNEADVAKIILHHPCRIRPEAYPDRVYEGYVTERSPEASREKGTLQVKVHIQHPDRFLTPELTAKVEFLKPDQAQAGAQTQTPAR